MTWDLSANEFAAKKRNAENPGSDNGSDAAVDPFLFRLPFGVADSVSLGSPIEQVKAAVLVA